MVDVTRNHDAVDSKHAGAVLVGSTPLTALRGRAALVGSEVDTEWVIWSAGCPAIREAVEGVDAAIGKLRAAIRQQETK